MRRWGSYSINSTTSQIFRRIAEGIVRQANMPTTIAIPEERIEKSILVIRSHKVLLDQDLATLYGVTTKQLNQQVRRNIERFPDDFMFQLTPQEFTNLRLQFVTASWGGRRTPPLAFTEQGVAMLSSVLHSQRAVQVNARDH